MSNDEVGHFIARRVAEELGWVDPVAEDEEVKWIWLINRFHN